MINTMVASSRPKNNGILFRSLAEYLFNAHKKEPRASSKTELEYWENGRIKLETLTLELASGGTFQETKGYYRLNGKMCFLSQCVKYKKEIWVRWKSWTIRGRKRLEFVKTDTHRFTKYHPAYRLSDRAMDWTPGAHNG